MYVLVAVVSLFLLINVPKVTEEARVNFANIRQSSNFKRMELFSRIDMILILGIVVVSAINF